MVRHFQQLEDRREKKGTRLMGVYSSRDYVKVKAHALNNKFVRS
jgi:hypothetical protein